MKAYFGATQLAGSDTSGYFDHAQQIEMEGDTLVQEEPQVRGTAPARFDRKNYTRRCSFRVTVTAASFEAAVTANASLLDTIKGLATFTLKKQDDTTVLTINNAKCGCRMTDGGAYVIRDFTIEGTA